MAIITDSKYVHFVIYVDGKYCDKLTTRRHTWYDPAGPKTYQVEFNHKVYSCTHNLHDQNIRARLDFTTIKGATLSELFAEIGRRFDERSIAADAVVAAVKGAK